MTETDAYEAISQRFATQWAALHPVGPNYVPLALDNEIFDAADRWARLSLVPTVSIQATLGAPVRWERRGRVAVQLFALAAAGARDLLAMINEVRGVLEGTSIASGDERVNLGPGSASPPITDGKWFTSTVVVEYWLHDQH